MHAKHQQKGLCADAICTKLSLIVHHIFKTDTLLARLLTIQLLVKPYIAGRCHIGVITDRALAVLWWVSPAAHDIETLLIPVNEAVIVNEGGG